MSDLSIHNIPTIIAQEIGASPTQVNAAITLLDEGATVPFIARYRKEATGGLDDTQLRKLEERLLYLRELNERRKTILTSIKEQEKLTPELEQALYNATSKQELEDLYLPYRPKRRTRAQIALEAGIEPLAQALFQSEISKEPDQLAEQYINEEAGFPDSDKVLEGARFILIDQIAEQAELLGRLRTFIWNEALLTATVVEGKEEEGRNYQDYFEFSEPIKKIPSHRALALLRGSNEEILTLDLTLPEAIESTPIRMIEEYFSCRSPHPWLATTIRLSWRAKMRLSISNELINRLREEAEAEAIRVFARNLSDLLLASPAGERVILGVDPGFRTGCKIATVDETGKLMTTATIYPHAPQKRWDEALATLTEICKQDRVELVAIGNGTASRETDRLIAELRQTLPHLNQVVVNEAGASVYSASQLAAEEFPDLDVALRGAVSIARRLQDPLAELVKIEPKSIGVGQYQHDVNQTQLSRTLEAVVEDCVNAVGVDVNTASSALLAQVSGLNRTTAQNIVTYRDTHGPFPNRKTIAKVPRIGPKTFELAAGFLRIRDGENPLDYSAVHPEAYPVVERILKKSGKSLKEVIGNTPFLKSLNPNDFTCETFGAPTVTDILKELDKPGRDPRPEFVTATFRDDVENISDLKPNMVLEGVITNVANFGAFVDIGVHQDGLIHISAMANHFVKDPHTIVTVGEVVKVKVMEIDIPRNRIGLSLRLEDEAPEASDQTHKGAAKQQSKRRERSEQRIKKPQGNNPFADALKGLKSTK